MKKWPYIISLVLMMRCSPNSVVITPDFFAPDTLVDAYKLNREYHEGEIRKLELDMEKYIYVNEHLGIKYDPRDPVLDSYRKKILAHRLKANDNDPYN